MRIVPLSLGVLGLLLLVAGTASATHYRYGTLSWEPTGAPGEVLFTGGQAWRASAFGNPAVGAVVQGESTIRTGDGNGVAYWLKVTSRSVVNDYFTATIVSVDGSPGVRYTYAAPNNNGAPWVASFSSCCRISEHSSGNYHANNPDQSERLETLVDLADPTNSAPKSSLPPINSCPREALCSILIPRTDAEGDTVTFRLASAAEAGDNSYRVPGPPQAVHAASVDPATGVLTWDTRGATVSSDPDEHTLYSIQVVLEDGRAKTPLDFFLEILPHGVQPPRWETPPSPCGETLHAQSGVPFSFVARAVSDDDRPVLVADLGVPPGAAIALPPPSDPAEATFTWTPTSAQAGAHLVVLVAEDDRGYAAPPCAVTIEVDILPIARAGPDRCVPLGTTVLLDGSASTYDAGTIVAWRWDFPHGPSPLLGPIVARTLASPEDLLEHEATLTITTSDGLTATDTVLLQAFDTLDVHATTSAPRYTPFQRPRGEVAVEIPCGAPSAGALVTITLRYTTHDPTLDDALTLALGPEALLWETSAVVGADGKVRWEAPFTVAERYALPLGLLNPTSQLLVLQGDYVLHAHAAGQGAEGAGSVVFDVVLDPQFPLDEPPAAPPPALPSRREEGI